VPGSGNTIAAANDYVDGGDNTDTRRADAGDEVHSCEL
jgi:hypothetical protein